MLREMMFQSRVEAMIRCQRMARSIDQEVWPAAWESITHLSGSGSVSIAFVPHGEHGDGRGQQPHGGVNDIASPMRAFDRAFDVQGDRAGGRIADLHVISARFAYVLAGEIAGLRTFRI